MLAVAALVCGCTRTAALAAKPALEPAHIPVSIPQPPSLPSHGILFRIEPAQAVADTAAPETQSRPPRASSYLFGTIHFGNDEELGLSPELLASALSSSFTLVNEIDLAAPGGGNLDRYRWLPPEQSLSALISAAGFAMAQSLLPQIPPPTLQRMKPWMVLALLEARGEQAGEQTLDDRLQRIAAERGMRIVHLETAEDQLRALDCIPSESQALVLEERLKAPQIMREMSERALMHYRGRDLDAWLADVDRMVGLDGESKDIEMRARQCLIEERNQRWLPELLALLDQGGCYIAVGAIHLPGEHGLLAALKHAGYRIEAEPL
ncbi:TraB/GumN family protein [Lysobacter sp. TAB13]|uniref:TraB/GumN family protein n=1 Tax=Lysobacter sp. TAB13 TaxID=3233065 RepID=UPI003F98474B